jgi:TonB family protein
LFAAEAEPNADDAVLLNIPAQPLAGALERFMAATKVAVIVDSKMIAGHTSATLQGSFSPESALRVMLAGTGLDPRSLGAAAYTLIVLPAVASRPPSRFIGYAANVQQAVTTALCQRDETRPTHYRVVMRLWLNPDGTVTRVELGHTTGNPTLDMAIGDTLQNINVGAPTPSGLPQPVKLAIVPRVISDEACGSDRPGGQSIPSPGH